MQRFGILIDEQLGKGLRAKRTSPRQSVSIEELIGVRVGRAGLENRPSMTQPFSVDFQWPFPQLFHLEREWLLAYDHNVYRIDPVDWSKSLLFGATSDMTWHVADFFDFIVMTNGAEVYVRDPDTGSFGKSTLPHFKTCCNFNGQLIVGNLSSFYDADSRFVAWSNIGEAILEPDRKNEAGYAPAEVGEVFKVLPFQKGFIAYGSEGVTAFPATQGNPPTFGKVKVADFGLASRDSAAEVRGQHVFLDDSAILWSLTGDLELKELGYEEFFEPMLGNDIVITPNPHKGDFYISDGNRTFLLSRGLSEVDQIVTSLTFYNGENVAVFQEADLPGFHIGFGPLDFGWGGIKRLESIELGINVDDRLEASTDWRMDVTQDWRESKWRRLNDVGSGVLRVKGKEFKPQVRASDASSVNLDWVRLWYKVDDQRFVRGQANDS
jgi:hypothetical protein